MTEEDDEQRSGEAGDPGQVRPEPPTEEAPTREQAPQIEAGEPAEATGGIRRLLRSRDDRVIAGVAGGLGRYFGIDPVIVRIGFALTIFFGGLGVLAYVAAALFVPNDDGTGSPAPSRRGHGIARAVGVVVIAMVALSGFGALAAAAAVATGVGYGLLVLGAVAVIGIALIALSFRGGGAMWLLVPALALSVGVGAASAADLDLSGGVGERDYRPSSAAEIPPGGYELGVGRLAVDLRGIDWSPSRVLDLDVRLGAGEAVIAVPAGVCVEAQAHARAGELAIAGQRADGIDVDALAGEGARAQPRLVLDARVDVGEIAVINDDRVELESIRGDGLQSAGLDDRELRAANGGACRR